MKTTSTKEENFLGIAARGEEILTEVGRDA